MNFAATSVRPQARLSSKPASLSAVPSHVFCPGTDQLLATGDGILGAAMATSQFSKVNVERRLPTTSRIAKKQDRKVEAQVANEVTVLAWEHAQILQVASIISSCCLLGVFIGLVILRIESIYWEKRQEQWRREGRIK